QGEDFSADQTVMQHDVRLAEPLQRLEGQQRRIAWPSADEADPAPRRGARGRMLEPEVKSLARFAFVSVQRMARKLAAELRLPEGAPRRRRQSRLDPGAQFAGEPRECCEAMWQHRLEPLPQAAGEHGCGAAGRNRDDEWRTIDDRGD